jgi:hypothetical protein
MKTLIAIPLALLLVGCSSTSPPPVAALSPDQAKVLAQHIANEQAQTLYGQRPFSNGAPARIHDGGWIWRDRRACGSGDMEATVILAADGSPRHVKVLLLDSRTMLNW